MILKLRANVLMLSDHMNPSVLVRYSMCHPLAEDIGAPQLPFSRHKRLLNNISQQVKIEPIRNNCFFMPHRTPKWMEKVIASLATYFVTVIRHEYAASERGAWHQGEGRSVPLLWTPLSLLVTVPNDGEGALKTRIQVQSNVAVGKSRRI